jgi:hypothetical protein
MFYRHIRSGNNHPKCSKSARVFGHTSLRRSLAEGKMNLSRVFRIVTPCNDVVGYQRFGRPCCLHLQVVTSNKSSHASDLEVGVELVLNELSRTKSSFQS